VNPCACGHAWVHHTGHASGAQRCRHTGCGCRDFNMSAYRTPIEDVRRAIEDAETRAEPIAEVPFSLEREAAIVRGKQEELF
jgi:predicted  nucleic acid-binding Zn-ribbon protein